MTGAPQWSDVIARLNGGRPLSYQDAYWVMDQVMTGEPGDARLASFPTAMAIKGATVDEIPGLADALPAHARAMGANAVVGIYVGYEAIGSSKLRVTGSGTAVIVE